MFFFASSERSVQVLESGVGPCQFCSAPSAVDIVEYRTKQWWFGLIPSDEQVDRMAVCRQCRRSIKEVYYNLREKSKQEEDFIPMVEGKLADY